MGDELKVTPRCLSKEEASAYLGISVHTFLRLVADGKAPSPLEISSRRRVWDVRAIDKFVDELAQ
jgi:predicted DNA-binding transcriptional regulator AlpA